MFTIQNSPQFCFQVKFQYYLIKIQNENPQFVVTVRGWFEPVSGQQQVQQLVVVNSRIGGPSSGHNLPHGHPEWPLRGQGKEIIVVLTQRINSDI